MVRIQGTFAIHSGKNHTIFPPTHSPLLRFRIYHNPLMKNKYRI